MKTWILGLVVVCSLAWLSSGTEAWQIRTVGTATASLDLAFAVAVDAAGNVVTAGMTDNRGTAQGITVIKFDGVSGAELWHQVLTSPAPGFNDAAYAAVVDGVGDVIVAGAVMTGVPTRATFTVLKLDGASGAVRWRQDIPDGQAHAVAVDAAGDVIAAGFLTTASPHVAFTVVKLDGTSGTERWRQVITGTDPSGSSVVSRVAVDTVGDVVAAGFLWNAGTGEDFTVIKFDGISGAERWRQVIDGPAHGQDVAQAVAVDAAGDVVAAGWLTTPGAAADFTVIKLDGVSGAERWRQVINGTANSNDIAQAVAVDAAGDVVAAGSISATNLSSPFTVLKLDGASGAERWRQGITNGVAWAVAVDAAGDVIAAGSATNPSSPFTVLKLDGASGAERWRQGITGKVSGGRAQAVAVDAAGDVVTAGWIFNAGLDADYTVLKVEGTSGTERWRQVINGTAPGRNIASAVALDAAGDVVAAGSSENIDTAVDFTVVKLDEASGAERWRQVINGTANSMDQAQAVAVDAAGDVVAAGGITNVGSGSAFTVLKLDGASGAERWRQGIHGPVLGSGSDLAQAVAVDTGGDVVAAGFTTYSNSAPDLTNFTVVKLDGASGAERWRQVITGSLPGRGDAAGVVAVDAAGDVVAAGKIRNTGSFASFAVLKLDGASGAERWRQVITGTASSISDGVRAVAVDTAGNVVAAGVTTNTATTRNFTVVKLDGASGAERWRQGIPGGGAIAVAVDAAGDVVAAGSLATPGTGNNFTVFKFDGASGAERWRQGITSIDAVRAVAVDAAGDVVAAGPTATGGTSPDFFTVIKFDGASGAERWRRVIPTPSGCCLSAVRAVAVDAAGDVVAAGSIQDSGGSDFTVVKLRGTDGGDFEARACVGTGAARLRGRVRVADPPESADVTLRLRGPGDCRETTTTNAQGRYVFRTLGPGTYTVTPAKDACTFTPVDRTVTIAARVVRARFRGTCP